MTPDASSPLLSLLFSLVEAMTVPVDGIVVIERVFVSVFVSVFCADEVAVKIVSGGL